MNAVDPSNWRRALEVQFVCPDCGKANRPDVISVHIEQHDVVACDSCGCHGVIQDFLPKENA